MIEPFSQSIALGVVWTSRDMFDVHLEHDHVHEYVAKFGAIVRQDFQWAPMLHQHLIKDKLYNIVCILRSQWPHFDPLDQVVGRYY